MHRDVVAGEDRRVRAHCLAANWQVRDMVACCVVGRVIRDGPIIHAFIALERMQSRGADAQTGLAASPSVQTNLEI
jgi:hypothetical protein